MTTKQNKRKSHPPGARKILREPNPGKQHSALSRRKLFWPKMISFPEVIPGVPSVLFVEFLGPTGEALPVSNGFVILAPRTFIKVIFSAPVSQAFFFLTPCWAKFFQPSQLVGFEVVDPPQRSIRFIWNVPPGIRNTLFIFGCSEIICGRPKEFLVMSQR